MRVDPPGYVRYRVDLHETRPILLQAGDAIRWTRDDAERELLSGARAEILEIGGSRLRLRTEDGREVALPRGDPQLRHLDHAYASSARAAEGLACDSVIAVVDSNLGPLEDQAAFYRTRARDGLVLLTDDREALTEALEKDLPSLQAGRPAPKLPDRPPAADERARSAGERRVLLAEADRGGGAVAELRGYGAWRRRAEEVAADDPETQRALRLDDLCVGLLRDWRKEPSDDLAARTEAYAAEANRPGEMPGELVRFLAERKAFREAQERAARAGERRSPPAEADRAPELPRHGARGRRVEKSVAAERALDGAGKTPVITVDRAGEAKRPGEPARPLDAPRQGAHGNSRLAIVRACAARRDRLLERAGKSDRPFASGFRHWRWRRMAKRAETAGRELLERGDLDDGTRREVAGVLEGIERSRTFDVLPVRILRGLRDNAARGVDPRLTAEYDGIVLEMELLPPHPEAGPARPARGRGARRAAGSGPVRAKMRRKPSGLPPLPRPPGKGRRRNGCPPGRALRLRFVARRGAAGAGRLPQDSQPRPCGNPPRPRGTRPASRGGRTKETGGTAGGRTAGTAGKPGDVPVATRAAGGTAPGSPPPRPRRTALPESPAARRRARLRSCRASSRRRGSSPPSAGCPSRRRPGSVPASVRSRMRPRRSFISCSAASPGRDGFAVRPRSTR